MASGLKQIKKELGPDALILSTRTVRSGRLGFLGKAMLEITAAVDSDYPAAAGQVSARPVKSRPFHNPSAPPPTTGRGGFRQVVDEEVLPWLHQGESQSRPERQADSREIRRDGAAERGWQQSRSAEEPDESREAKEAREIREIRQASQTRRAREDEEERRWRQAQEAAAALPQESTLHDEVGELKELVKSLAAQIAGIRPEEEPARRGGTLAIRDSDHASSLGGNPIQGDHLLSLLVARGIHVESARTIAGFLRESLTPEELTNPELVRSHTIATIENLIEVAEPTGTGEQQRLALVGPTGVGKTTTLAKIAASRLAAHGNSIALLTIDTYRIAAVEQLKVYGELMDLPVEVVITPEELQQALERHADKELILIDTAGRSPRDSLSIAELATFLTPELAIDTHLVLSATSREEELLATIDRFNALQIDKTIFTKVDECDRLGVLLNVQIHNPCPLAYVTNGQRVPEDLLAITPRLAAELILSPQQEGLHG